MFLEIPCIAPVDRTARRELVIDEILARNHEDRNTEECSLDLSRPGDLEFLALDTLQDVDPKRWMAHLKPLLSPRCKKLRADSGERRPEVLQRRKYTPAVAGTRRNEDIQILSSSGIVMGSYCVPANDQITNLELI